MDTLFNDPKFLKLIKSYEKYDREELSKWLNNLESLIYKLMIDYRIDDLSILNGGRLGLILSGYSDYFEFDVVLKIIPNFLNTYEIELNAYKSLSGDYMCPFLDYRKEDNVLVLKKLEDKPFNFKTEKTLIRKFFDTVYDYSFVYDKELENNSYKDILINNIRKVKNCNIDLDNRKLLENYVIDLCQDLFLEKEQYLIHGDLHAKNVLHEGKNLKAIDPLGYVAPIDFTFVRFVIVELFYSDEINNYFEELFDFISCYGETKDLLNALLVDSYLFLTSLYIQIDNPDILFEKVKQIINLILKKMKELGVDFKNEKSCNNLTKTRECFFRG